jgi:hypothetical protein
MVMGKTMSDFIAHVIPLINQAVASLLAKN